MILPSHMLQNYTCLLQHHYQSGSILRACRIGITHAHPRKNGRIRRSQKLRVYFLPSLVLQTLNEKVGLTVVSWRKLSNNYLLGLFWVCSQFSNHFTKNDTCQSMKIFGIRISMQNTRMFLGTKSRLVEKV